MNRKTTLAIATFVASIAALGTPVLAASSTADTHAYFERERARLEGQVAPVQMARYQGAAPIAAPVQRTAADAYFEYERARSEGSDPYVSQGEPSLRESVHAVMDTVRGSSR